MLNDIQIAAIALASRMFDLAYDLNAYPGDVFASQRGSYGHMVDGIVAVLNQAGLDGQAIYNVLIECGQGDVEFITEVAKEGLDAQRKAPRLSDLPPVW